MAKPLNLINANGKDLSIFQGATFQKHFIYNGDASLATPRGQIRNKLPSDSSLLLAEFSFVMPIVYNLATKTSVIIAQLSATITQSLPATDYQGSGKATQSNCFVYDIELEFPSGIVEKVVTTSLIQVTPEVTISIT
jgi:hypothetical protein